MMGHKEKMKSAAEYHVVCARGYYYYLANSTAAHKIKRQMSKRARREAKMELRDEISLSNSQ